MADGIRRQALRYVLGFGLVAVPHAAHIAARVAADLIKRLWIEAVKVAAGTTTVRVAVREGTAATVGFVESLEGPPSGQPPSLLPYPSYVFGYYLGECFKKVRDRLK